MKGTIVRTEWDDKRQNYGSLGTLLDMQGIVIVFSSEFLRVYFINPSLQHTGTHTNALWKGSHTKKMSRNDWVQLRLRGWHQEVLEVDIVDKLLKLLNSFYSISKTKIPKLFD